jgi:hypothetical protein
VTAVDPFRAVYRDRAHLLPLLAALFPAVMSMDVADQERPDVLYLDTPRGQLSWHIDPADLPLFDGIERVAPTDPRAQWDGHTTDEKNERLRQLAADLAKWGGLRELLKQLLTEGI